MNVIDLENLKGLPNRFINELFKNNNRFKKHDFIEQLFNNEDINTIIVQIDDYCKINLIFGFHFTNAIEYDIHERGLLIRTGSEIRNEFINKHGYLFSGDEIDVITKSWKLYFDEKDMDFRDNRIWFNFTQSAIHNGGAELLLKYFGGEQVYAPIYQLPGIGYKLTKIGIPLIVKCRLNPIYIKTSTDYPWGKIAVSSYHRMTNSKAFTYDQDGYQIKSVPKNDIEFIKI